MLKQRREVVELIRARPASDGDGVKLLRVFGGHQPQRFDPFLLLDEFGSDRAADYIGGFPPHPHRGFETVTYMLEGKMEHRDHMDNVGLLSDGGVQWMTAGRGVIHSEMPKQTRGRMRGFQLWVNLPGRNKLVPAGYADIPAEQIPVYPREFGSVKAIAGSALIDGERLQGFFDKPDTEPLYWDLRLDPGQDLSLEVEEGFTSLAYVYEGAVEAPAAGGRATIPSHHLARFGTGGDWQFSNRSKEPARFLVLAGRPLKEPIVQYGPFVMNTTEEIDQAIRDYQSGVLTGVGS